MCLALVLARKLLNPESVIEFRLEEENVMRRVQILAMILVLPLAACSTPLTTREKGAVTGVAVGAGTGAIIGSATGHTAQGALIGGAIGGVSGAVIGDAIQSKEQTAPPAVQAPPPPPPAPSAATVPPPPPVVIHQPQYVWVPAWGVYVIEDYDIVYYEPYFYYFHGGHWYYGRHYSGPWVFVQVASLPSPVRRLPPGHFKTHIPPGQAKKHWRGHGPPAWRR